MGANDIYVFQIDAYAPETIPMVRLATYLLELARLFGEPERVHFDQHPGQGTGALFVWPADPPHRPCPLFS